MKEIVKTGIDEKYYYAKLNNGLSIYLAPNTQMKSFYATFSVRFGSIHTEFRPRGAKKNISVPPGIAHFLEHQLFEEKNGKSAHEYFSDLGSTSNAFTSYDVTCYEVIGNNFFKENLEALINFVQNPHFSEKSVKKEKGIIKEEIKMLTNNPHAQMYLGMNKNLYFKDNHRHKVSGEIEDIDQITHGDLQLCYDCFYHPENMFIIITGNFNHYEALSIIKENQSKKEFNSYNYPVIKKFIEPNAVKYQETITPMNVSVPKVYLAYKLSNKQFNNLKINIIDLKVYITLIMYAKFGLTSNINQDLLYSQLISSPLSVLTFFTKDHIILGVSCTTKYTEEVIERIKKEMQNLVIGKDDFNRKIKTTISDYISIYDDIENVCLEMQSDIIKYGKPIDNFYEILHNLDYSTCTKVASSIVLNDYSLYKIVGF